MNIQKALDELEIDLNEIELTNLDISFIKSKYHKMALKWHPDKNENAEATCKFQSINDAYKYLEETIHKINKDENVNNDSKTYNEFVSSSSCKESNIYIDILSTFICSLLNGSYTDLFIKVVKEIVIDYKGLSLSYLKEIFSDLEKESSMEVFHFLNKYKDILYINEETLELVSLIIKDKYKNDRVFILKPLIKDLWENNIYKLYLDDKLYLVPLWHNELYFDAKDGTEIIVLIQPLLEENLSIDENNNIIVTKKICIEKELKGLITNGNFVSLFVGGKEFQLSLSELFIKKVQIVTLKGKGISRVLEKDMYNVSNKADIIIKIILH
jgi:hypothetical protein